MQAVIQAKSALRRPGLARSYSRCRPQPILRHCRWADRCSHERRSRNHLEVLEVSLVRPHGHARSDRRQGRSCAARGTLVPDDNRATLDRLWDPLVASWFEHGRDDPQLRLLRFDSEQAQIWLNENSLFSEIRLLLGRDTKSRENEKVAEVELDG